MQPAEVLDEFTTPSVTDEQLLATHHELDEVIRYQKGARYPSRTNRGRAWKDRGGK